MMEPGVAPAGVTKRRSHSRAAPGAARGHKDPREELADGVGFS